MILPAIAEGDTHLVYCLGTEALGCRAPAVHSTKASYLQLALGSLPLIASTSVFSFCFSCVPHRRLFRSALSLSLRPSRTLAV